jgi:hypothetical protein
MAHWRGCIELNRNTPDNDEPDEDSQEVCSSGSGEGYWVRFRGAGLELAFAAGKDSCAIDEYAVWGVH